MENENNEQLTEQKKKAPEMSERRRISALP